MRHKLVFLGILVALVSLFVCLFSPFTVSAQSAVSGPIGSVWEQYKGLVDGGKLAAILGLIAVIFLTGVAVAFKEKDPKTGKIKFNLKDMGNFFETKVLVFLVAYYAIALAVLADPTYSKFLTAAYGVLIATLTAGFFANLSKLGIPIPEILGGQTTPASSLTTPTQSG